MAIERFAMASVKACVKPQTAPARISSAIISSLFPSTLRSMVHRQMEDVVPKIRSKKGLLHGRYR